MDATKPIQGMDEIELRAHCAELDQVKATLEHKMTDKNEEIEELKATIKMYAEENKRLHLLKKGTAPKGGPNSANQMREELARLQIQTEDVQKTNSHLQKNLNAAEKQLSATNAAAMWAHTQLTVVVQQLQGLNTDLEQMQGTPLKGRKARRSTSPGPQSENAQKILSELCQLITLADQGVQVMRKRFVSLDIDDRIKELETQLKQWKTKAERQRGEVESVENENRELRDRIANGGLPMPKENETRIVQPEVIRMPSHSAHSVNAEHWPVRSVACQTPRGEEQWVWSISGEQRSPRASHARSAVTSTWDAPPGPGTPPISPVWTSPSGTYDSPKARRTTSPGRGHKGLVSSAVLRRHMGSRSPFRGSNGYV